MDELLEEYGADTVRAGLDALQNRAEALMRAERTTLPDGRWTATDYLDNDGITDVALPIVVVVELIVCCDTVPTDDVVVTPAVGVAEDADVVPTVDVPEDADVVATVDDDPGNVDVLTVVAGPPDALVTDTAVLDC